MVFLQLELQKGEHFKWREKYVGEVKLESEVAEELFWKQRTVTGKKKKKKVPGKASCGLSCQDKNFDVYF